MISFFQHDDLAKLLLLDLVGFLLVSRFGALTLKDHESNEDGARSFVHLGRSVMESLKTFSKK